MRDIIRKSFLLILAIGSVSCTEDFLSVKKNYTMTIDISVDDAARVKASTQDGEDLLNENKINTIDLFLYRAGQTGNNALKRGRYVVNANGTSQIDMDFTNTEFAGLFPNAGDNCELFVIANLPEGVTIPANTSVPSLKSIVISSDFRNTFPQPYFVMTGQTASVQSSVNGSKWSATGSVALKRVAAKLTMNLEVEQNFNEVRDEGTIPWTSHPERMTVTFYNATGTGDLGGDTSSAGVLFNYERRNSFVPVDQTYDVSTPWYSYPRAWGSENYCYVLVTVPWSRPLDLENPGNGDKYQNCYYKIVLNTNDLQSNKWYYIKAKMEVLGSFYQDAPTLVLPSHLAYSVLDWKAGIEGDTSYNTDAEIKDARYLAPSKYNYVLENVNSISIPFSSSNDVAIKGVTAKYWNYSGSNAVQSDLSNLTGSPYTCVLDGSSIVLRHDLKNNINVTPLNQNSFDYVEFSFVITIGHSDTDEYNTDITVLQRPALMLTAEENTQDSQNTRNTTIVNGNTNNRNSSWYASMGRRTSGSDNTSPYMFIAQVSQSDDYVIGDPRESFYQSGTDLGMNPVAATAAAFFNNGTYYANPSNTSRQLRYYYATKSSDEVTNMIAPKFRISSANAYNSNAQNANEVKWRCATYQEFGHPAGRWRVPTLAEMRFMALLSANGLIPSMFNDGSNYWAADGIYTYSYSKKSFTSNNNVTTAYSRCVYDEWYWEKSNYARLTATSTPNYRTFVWGDMPRENFK